MKAPYPRPGLFLLIVVLLTTAGVAMAVSFYFRQRFAAASAASPRTLTLWYLGGSEHNDKRFTDESLRRYEQAHPDTRISVTYFSSLEEYVRILNSALNGQTAFPDLARSDQGAHSVDAVIRQGKLLDLTAAVEKHRWKDRLQPGMLEYLGRRYSGGLFLIPSRIHLGGVFYNRQVFERLGLQIPKTESEFEVLLARLKKEGTEPLELGGFPLYLWYALINNRLSTLHHPPAETLDDLFAGRKTVSFDSLPFRESAEKMKLWCDQGYFFLDSRNDTGTESYDRFLQGKSPMYVGLGGTWARARAQLHPPQFVIGFFPFPPAQMGQRPIALGSPTAVWQIFKGAREKQAIQLTDWMLSREVSRFQIEHENLPALRMDPLEGISLAPHVIEELTALKNCDLGIFYDNASPSLLDPMTLGMNRLLSGSQTADQFTAEIEATYKKDVNSIRLTQEPPVHAPQ